MADISETPRLRTLAGGDINQTYLCEFNRHQFVLKVNDLQFPQMFHREAQGLKALKEVYTLKIPQVIACQQDQGAQYILLEYIPPGQPSPGFFRDFGRQLAQSHQSGTFSSWGFEGDNYIGATPQVNTWESLWSRFYQIHRLGYQTELAKGRGLLSPLLYDRLLALREKLPNLLPEPKVYSLLHGDLWGGNFLVSKEGDPVLIDPAVYVGHNEADLAMTELFGGFPSDFYQGYNEVFPLSDNYQEFYRPLYQLYHMLNHLNLFGAGYTQGVESLVEQLS